MAIKREEKLTGVHPSLVKLAKKAGEKYNIIILEGVRDASRQKELFEQGKSKTLNSKHLIQKDGYSHAIDIAPDPVNWNDREQFVALSFYLKGLADSIGIEIRQGVDWDGDLNIKEHWFDGPHIELK
jgi:peptidoglycan LD-endopeptidase CwlK